MLDNPFGQPICLVIGAFITLVPNDGFSTMNITTPGRLICTFRHANLEQFDYNIHNHYLHQYPIDTRFHSIYADYPRYFPFMTTTQETDRGQQI